MVLKDVVDSMTNEQLLAAEIGAELERAENSIRMLTRGSTNYYECEAAIRHTCMLRIKQIVG